MLKQLLLKWREYEDWCKKQETNRFPKKWVSINSCVEITEWDIEFNMMPTFNGFMDYLTKYQYG